MMIGLIAPFMAWLLPRHREQAGTALLAAGLSTEDICAEYAERFVRSIEGECLSRMILFGDRSLRKALVSTPLTITGRGNIRDHAAHDQASAAAAVECVQRLGAILRFYHRVAA